MTPSTNVISHVIVFHDGSKKMITDAQASLVFQASGGQSKSITTPQLGLIMFSAISKIITLQEYYDQYPDQRPDNRPEVKLDVRAGYQSIEAQSLANTSRRQSLIQGLRRYITEEEAAGRFPGHAKQTLLDWENGNRQNEDEKQKGHWTKVYEKYKDKSTRTQSEEDYYQFAVKKVNELKILV